MQLQILQISQNFYHYRRFRRYCKYRKSVSQKLQMSVTWLKKFRGEGTPLQNTLPLKHNFQKKWLRGYAVAKGRKFWSGHAVAKGRNFR